jgi:hypothetical protein
MVLTGEY